MSRPLRVLLVEDRHDDAELILHELRRAGFEPHGPRVETELEFLAALDPTLDIILADYQLPHFDGLRALELIQERELLVPVIMLTGFLGDEAAVECLKFGACDYLLKDRLARLGAAVDNALEQTRARVDQERAEKALRESEARKAAILATALDGIITIDHQDRIVEFNPAAEAIFGHPRAEAVGQSVTELLLPPGWRERYPRGLAEYFASEECPMLGSRSETTALRADGTEILIELTVTRIHDDGPPLYCGYVRDITERRAAEEARCRLADIVQTFDDAVIGESLDGRIASWNGGAEKVFGYTAEEVIGQPIALLAPPTLVDESRRMVERIRRGERMVQFETLCRRKDGSEIVVSLTDLPIRDRTGHVVGAARIARDVTAQRRREQEIVRLNHELQDRVGELQTLLEILPVSVWIGDATAERIIGNRAAYEMMGLPAGTNLSPDAPDVGAGAAPRYRYFRDEIAIPPDELPLRTVARTGIGINNFEQDIRFDDGRITTIQGSVAPLFDDRGEIRGVVGACVNITERKRAEESLRTANRRKDQFLAALSHELRTPLTPVLMIVSAMLETDPTPEELRPCLTMIRDNVELEARLIDDLLDVARIAQGKLHLNREPVDVHALIFRALETCRDAIQDGGLHLSLDLSAPEHRVLADPVRLQQVFWNLIKNAAKFTPQGGEIAIRTRNESATASGPTARSLVVEVADNGIGIEADALARIFQVFEQGDASLMRRFGGLGLGLAISEAVAEAHGGRLTADSPGKDRGATFTLRLPAETGPASDPPARPPLGDQAERPAPLRVLLVEDNQDTLLYLGRALAQRRHTVRTAADLASARELVAAEDFDVVVSDLGLPDGSGLELMSDIVVTRGFPGIAMSGFGSEEDIRRAMEAGFAAHLTKPVRFQTLEATMRKVTSSNTRTAKPSPSKNERA